VKSIEIVEDLRAAKAAIWAITDVEGRRHREQTGLETLVVYAVNDECS